MVLVVTSSMNTCLLCLFLFLWECTAINTCTRMWTRREWRELSDQERSEFFKGIALLKKEKSRLGKHNLYEASLFTC